MQPPLNSNPGANTFPTATSNPTFAQTQNNTEQRELLDRREEYIEDAGYTVIRETGGIIEGDDMLIAFGATNTPLGNNSDYFLGSKPGRPQETDEGRARIYVLREGTVKRVAVQVLADGNFSSEKASLYLRKNGTTDYLITDQIDGSLLTQFITADVEIPMSKDDWFEMKLVTPTWNSGEGEGMPLQGQVYLQ